MLKKKHQMKGSESDKGLGVGRLPEKVTFGWEGGTVQTSGELHSRKGMSQCKRPEARERVLVLLSKAQGAGAERSEGREWWGVLKPMEEGRAQTAKKSPSGCW